MNNNSDRFFASVFSIFVFLIANCGVAKESDELLATEILGKWVFNLEKIDSSSGIGAKISGTTEYVGDGKFNFRGVATISLENYGELIYDLAGAGKWDITGGFITQTWLDMKSIVDNEKSFDMDVARSFDIKEFIPIGTSGSSKIMKLTKDMLILKSESDGGIVIAKRNVKNNDNSIVGKWKTAIITIDGIEHEININDNKKIKIGTKERIVNVKLSKYRLFTIDGISFKYNSNMTYTADTSDPDVSIWNMDGSTNIIMVQKYQKEIINKWLSDLIKQQLENMKATVTVKKSILKYKGSQLEGFRLNIKIGDIYLSQEIYSKVINGKTIGLIIQDTLNDDKSNSSEYKKSLELIQNTLSIK